MRGICFILVYLCCCFGHTHLFAQEAFIESKTDFHERMQWWADARFGMFLHWGVYSSYGGEWNGTDYGKETGGPSAEWIYLKADIPKVEYENTAWHFNPIKYDATAWVKRAKQAGVKYMILTAKHHDGFALFNTQASEWNIMDASKHKKDLIRSYVDACHHQGMHVGLYYSHEKDWYHRCKIHRDTSSVSEAYKALVRTHLKELLTNYGTIDVLWFDMGMNRHRDLNLMCQQLVREYQPQCIISSRIGNHLGDYKNLGDRELAMPGCKGYIESIMTMHLNWGFDKNDSEWKTANEVISMLSRCATRNSNFVLNLGPQPDGRFAPEENVRLQAIGEWLEKNGEAIYSTKGSPFQGEYHWGSLTHKKHRVYLHLFGSYGDEIKVNGIVSRVKKAWCLHNHEKVDFQQNPEEASFNLKVPLKASALPCPIIVLELAETLQVNKEKGPIDLPPVLKHLHRKSITGRITATEALGFTIENDNEKIKFKLNDKLKYRINDKGTIRQVSGFHLQEESEYKVVYTDVEEPKVNFITKIIDRK